MGTLISSVANFDLFGVFNPPACAAHTRLHAEPGQNPAIEDDPQNEESYDRQYIFHGCFFFFKLSEIVRCWWRTGTARCVIADSGRQPV